MKHIGIIAEYNPFHNGHLYQINTIKKIFPDKKTVICMSGSYVQRGEPAIFPISLRTECALAGGADLIIGLPSVFSSSSSEFFATAGVLSLYNTGIIDTLCFGAECNNLEMLSSLADFFLEESDQYKLILRNNLSKGISFPKARAIAASECLGNAEYTDILRHPNNILAIEYIKAIKKYKLPLRPYVIKRTSDNHSSLNTDNSFCSSSAIRNILYKNDAFYSPTFEKLVPETTLGILKNSPISKPVFFDDFYPFLVYKLLSDRLRLSDYYEVNESLANRINNISILPETFNELLDILSGKQITNARIRRCLLNIVLNRTNGKINRLFKNEYIKYIRILGVKDDSTELLRDMKNKCPVPLINKTASYRGRLNNDGIEMFETVIFENNLYRQVFYNKYGIALPTDYEQSVIIR